MIHEKKSDKPLESPSSTLVASEEKFALGNVLMYADNCPISDRFPVKYSIYNYKLSFHPNLYTLNSFESKKSKMS